MLRLARFTLAALCLSCATPPSSAEPETPTSKPSGNLDVPWPTEALPAVKALYAGSWKPQEPLGFEQALFDEAGLLSLPKNMMAGRRRWSGFRSYGEQMLVDTQIEPRKGPAMAYTWWLLTWDQVVGPPETDLSAVIHFRHRGRARVWLDGQLLFDEQPTEAGTWQTLQRAVMLTGSDDVFLVKTARGSPELGPSANFELRVSAPQGEALDGQIWQTVRVW
ncbi:MAG: hypothetical protein P8N09_06850 [Planctomycetota bacterium]|jgi:hypothetical protein|nr:hypothetical protein [Planctomycetota bacterium]